MASNATARRADEPRCNACRSANRRPCRDYTAHQFGQAEPGKARDDLLASGVTQSPPSWRVPEAVRPGARRLAPCDTIDTGADVLADLPAIPKAGTLSTARASQRHAARGTTSGADSAVRFLRRPDVGSRLSAPMRQPGPDAATACFCCVCSPACGFPNSSGFIARTRCGVSRRHYRTSRGRV